MKRIPILFAFVLCAAVFFVAGMRMGGPVYLAEYALSDALYKTVLLQLLRNGETDAAQETLENHLDDDLYTYATESRGYASIVFPGLVAEEETPKYLSAIAEYRRQHPHSSLKEYESRGGKDPYGYVRARQEVVDTLLGSY